MNVLDGLAASLVAAGVIAALLGIVIAPRRAPRRTSQRRARVQAGLGIMLDLWLAAGLLQLAGEPRWSTIGTNAILLALRMLLHASLVHAPG